MTTKKVGHWFVATSGEYSDFGMIGVFEFPSTRWVRDKLVEFLEEYPKQKEEYRGDEREFVGWLTENYGEEFKELEYTEVWLGAYGCLGPAVKELSEQVVREDAEKGNETQENG